MEKTQLRLASIIQKNIQEIIQFELKHLDCGIITVSEVKVSKDHSWATIYVTFLNKKENSMENLTNKSGVIRSLLAKKLTTRRVPYLRFIEDDIYQKSEYLEDLLKKI